MELDFKKAKNFEKNLLLTKYTQKQIYEFFLKEPLTLNKFYTSNLRYPGTDDEDNQPSLSFKLGEKKGDILFQDWGRGYKGDVYEYIQQYYAVRGEVLSFYEAISKCLYEIAFENIIKEGIEIQANSINKKRNLSYELSDFNKEDILYWIKYGITLKTLMKFNVDKVQTVYDSDSGQKLFYSTKDNPIYMYGNLGNSKLSFQLYRPLTHIKDYKFRNSFKQNDVILFGYDQLPNEGDILFITKSMKDVMCLYEFGITAVAPSSETSTIPDDYIEELKKRFSVICVLFDNDKTGENGAAQLVRKHGFKSRFIANDKAKDISDFYKIDPDKCKKTLNIWTEYLLAY